MTTTVAVRSATRTRPFWGFVLGLCVAVLVTFDAALIHLRTGYFSGGFQSPYVEGVPDVLAYFSSAAVLDAALVLGLWAAAGFAIRRCSGPLQTACVALLAGLALPLAAGAVLHGIHATLGGMIATSLLSSGSAGSSSTAAMLSEEATPFGVIAATAALLACAAAVVASGRLDRRHRYAPPAPLRGHTVAAACAAFTLAGSAILLLSATYDPLLRYGMQRKTSGIVLTRLVQWTTDVDRDGYGIFSVPPDPAHWNASVHPYAPEIPANGRDENGVGGDRPEGSPQAGAVAAGLPAAPAADAATAARPSLLIVFLESFRTDLLQTEIDGRPVVPFLSSLARDGASSRLMFVHSPWTLASRSQLFAGTLDPRPGEPTIVDDFKARGYTVALFSGQDDSYGDSVDLMGAGRADRFYDARQDLARRTSRTTAPVSLQVSWKTVLERVDEYLLDWRDDRPLLLYVNLVDTHYPYTHTEIDDLLDVGPLPRSSIRPHNAEGVFRGYANTAANVDLAVERLVRRWHQRFPPEESAILVTADHGQSFYEEGTLGHGQRLARAETQVPLILFGVGGTWEEPVAITDVRHLVARNLFLPRGGGVPRAALVRDPDRYVFQYLGTLGRPEQVGFRTANGLLAYDFLSGVAWRTAANDDRRLREPPDSSAIERLFWTWEILQERSAHEPGTR